MATSGASQAAVIVDGPAKPGFENDRWAAGTAAAEVEVYGHPHRRVDPAPCSSPSWRAPLTAALVLGEFRRLAKQAGSSPLTDREWEVFKLVVRGHSYRKIGSGLAICPRPSRTTCATSWASCTSPAAPTLVRYAADHGIG